MKTKLSLSVHHAKHKHPDNFTCEICGRFFMSRDSIRRHMKTHQKNADTSKLKRSTDRPKRQPISVQYRNKPQSNISSMDVDEEENMDEKKYGSENFKDSRGVESDESESDADNSGL